MTHPDLRFSIVFVAIYFWFLCSIFAYFYKFQTPLFASYNLEVGSEYVLGLLIVFTASSLAFAFGGILFSKKIRTVNLPTGFSKVFALYLPLTILLFLVAYAGFTFMPNTPLDLQSYHHFLDSFTGKAIIHLIPSGFLLLFVRGCLRKTAIISVITAVLLYVGFYSERAFIFYFFIMIFFLPFKRLQLKRFSYLSALLLFLGISVFVAIESSRSGKKGLGDAGLSVVSLYALERLVLYYKDTTIKSARCIEDVADGSHFCQRRYDEHASVTNRGGFYMLVSKYGWFGGGVIIFSAFFLAGVIIRQAFLGNSLCLFFSPQVLIFCFEFNRLNRLEFPIFYLVLAATLSLGFVSLLNSKIRKVKS